MELACVCAGGLLGKVEEGRAVADRADERVAVGREEEVAPLVHAAAQVRELCIGVVVAAVLALCCVFVVKPCGSSP